MQDLADKFKNARKFGCPIVGIETPDMGATISLLSSTVSNGDTPPVFVWDIINGMKAVNAESLASIAKMNLNQESFGEQTLNPVEMLSFCLKLEPRSIVFMQNAHRFYDAETICQAVFNIRDKFKQSRRTLVLLGPSLSLPVELDKDVIVFSENLPDDFTIGKIADDLYAVLGSTTKFPKVMREQTIRASRGLSAFAAEQSIALSLEKTGVNVDTLWSYKKAAVEQTRGLSFAGNDITFSDIGGLQAIKEFGSKLFSGPKPPALICWIDEIEKAVGGASGDTSGTSQDQLGVLLKNLEDTDSAGLIAVGPPGAGKSLLAKALGATHHVPTLFVDLGSAKGSLVGQSETRIRDMMKKINAIAGQGGAFWIATANKLDVVPPELRRRFRFGTWMFALPDAEEREQIWNLNLKRYGLEKKGYNRPADEFLTGADIRSICELSWRLGVELEKAMTYISPIAISSPESIENLYRAADGRFLSASYGGLFRRNKADVFEHGRQVSV